MIHVTSAHSLCPVVVEVTSSKAGLRPADPGPKAAAGIAASLDPVPGPHLTRHGRIMYRYKREVGLAHA